MLKKRAEQEEFSRRDALKMKFFSFFIGHFFHNSNIPLKTFLEKMEKNIILKTLYRVNGGQKRAAEILGIKYTTLNEKIKKYRIRLSKDLFFPEER